MTINTISRELLNNAYNHRFRSVSKQSKETIKETVVLFQTDNLHEI